jgi:hypothetical protein
MRTAVILLGMLSGFIAGRPCHRPPRGRPPWNGGDRDSADVMSRHCPNSESRRVCLARPNTISGAVTQSSGNNLPALIVARCSRKAKGRSDLRPSCQVCANPQIFPGAPFEGIDKRFFFGYAIKCTPTAHSRSRHGRGDSTYPDPTHSTCSHLQHA